MRIMTLGACALVSSTCAFAQGLDPQDGRWRGSIGAGLSLTDGNTRSQSLNVDAAAARATAEDRWSLTGKALYGRSEGETSANQVRLGTRYDRNLSAHLFGFIGATAERDPIAELSSRLQGDTGIGYKIVDTPELRWNVFGGAGYVRERYTVPRLVEGTLVEGDRYATALFGEESAHKFTDTLSARQRFVVYPNLRRSGEYRADLDAGLAVALTNTLGLNVGLTMRHDTAAAAGTKQTDTLLTTGVTYKFE
jgi:putative salt-induced outer membrane protein